MISDLCWKSTRVSRCVVVRRTSVNLLLPVRQEAPGNKCKTRAPEGPFNRSKSNSSLHGTAEATIAPSNIVSNVSGESNPRGEPEDHGDSFNAEDSITVVEGREELGDNEKVNEGKPGPDRLDI